MAFPGTIVLMRDAEDMGAEGEEEGVGTGAEAGAVAGTGGKRQLDTFNHWFCNLCSHHMKHAYI